jgi:hypothetical protein
MRRLVSGLLVTLLMLSFLIPGIQFGLGGKDGAQPVGAGGTTYVQAGTSVGPPVSVSAGAQGQSGVLSDADYGVIARTQVNSSTYNPSKPTNWVTNVASNLYFNTTTYGWVSQSFDSNRTWGNWIRLTHIATADPHNYVMGLELLIYDYSTSQWLTPNFIYSTCGNSTPAYWLIDGATGTSWLHSVNELHEVVVGFYSAIQVSRVELFVMSSDNRSFWQTVQVDVANGWQTVGSSPWLSSSDGNYVWTGSNGNTIGDFTFSQNQYVWTEDRVANAYLELNFTKTLPDTNITLAYYNLNSWSSVTYSTSTVNQWVAMNATLSANWGNQTVMNNFKIRMTSQTSAVDTLKIEHAYFYWNTSTIASRIAYYLNAPSSVANWTQNYFGLLFGKVSKADMANYIDSLANNQQWLDVIRWSVRCMKLGIQETDQVKWALGNITQVGGTLPNTTKYLDGEDAFSVYEREVLYGCFYYANQLNYLTNKWSIGMAYSYFAATVANALAQYGYPALLMVENNHNPVDGFERFYDECAETISCYLIFYELKVTPALNDALTTWNWVNSNCWDAANGHYKYEPTLDYYECEGAFFPRIAAILQYFDWAAGNISRTTLDVYNRFLASEWASPQWTQSDGTLAYSVVHSNPGNVERRLENTFGAWFMMLGLYTILNSTAQAKYQDMLLHSAWSKIYSPNSLLYNPTTHAFKMSSDASSTDPSATVLAVTMQLAQGIVPITTSLAYPLEELHYEYIWDVDPLNLAMDYGNSMLNVSVSGAGTLRFVYGVAPVDYYFSQPGSYQITFANAWTTITNVTRLGDLPLNRKYIGKYQITFAQTGAYADFPGTILAVDGANYIPANLPASFTWDLGSSHTFAFNSPLLVLDHNKQYVWTNTTGLTTLQSGSLNVTIFGVITGIYKTQYYLTVSSQYATPGGQGWYDYNAIAYAALDTGFVDQGNGTGRAFTSWSGDASGTNFTQSDPMMMTSARTALANWKAQYNVTFTHSDLDPSATGTVATVNGTLVSYNQLPYNLWVDSGGTISYAYNDVASLNTGERFILVNVTGPPSPTTVTGPVTVTGNYKTQYYLTNIATYGIPIPVSGWFDNGTSITASVPTPYYFSSDTRYECIGWTGTGSVPSSGTDANVTFTITQPSQIVWKWKLQYRLGVFINPSMLNPTPNMNPLGENDTVQGYYWYDENTIVTLTAQTVLGYTFDKWNVDGSLYGTGVNPIIVVMDGPHVTTALYTARDVAVSNVAPSKTVVNQGYPMNITVTVANLGHVSETFNVTVYANSTALTTQTVTLQNMTSTTITVTLDSSSFAYGKLSIWANASTVPGEVNTANNTFNDGNVTVTILGDVNGDFKVTLADLVLLANAYNSQPGSPKWNPNADLNGNGVVNLSDLVIMALHYGQHYP